MISKEMNDAHAFLSKYFDILEGIGTAQYLKCKYTPISFDTIASTEELWDKHDRALQTTYLRDVEPEQSLLDIKIELATRIFHECVFCERRCKVDRSTTVGNCGVQESRIASEFLHLGEESVLVPSYTIFFSGCTFHCVFCQNWDISQRIGGAKVAPVMLARMIDQRKHEGAKNVNWVGGDPTSNLLYILQVLKKCETNLPQVWNSNMYCSRETMKLLHGIIDVYLTDFKYGNDLCARQLSGVDHYTKIIERNHELAYNHGEVIVRHLVMPNHTACCSEPVIHWISMNIPNAVVNIMVQYRPEYKAREFPDINRPISLKEFTQVKKFAEQLHIHEV